MASAFSPDKLSRARNVSLMSTVTEILEAVKRLPKQEKGEFLERMEENDARNQSR